jgi:hypothetical protein
MRSLAGKRRHTYGSVSQKEISSSPFAYDAAHPNAGGHIQIGHTVLQTDKFVLRELEPARVTVTDSEHGPTQVVTRVLTYECKSLVMVHCKSESVSGAAHCPAHGRSPWAVRQSKNLAAKLTRVRVGGDSRPRRVSPGPAATASELGSARLRRTGRARLHLPVFDGDVESLVERHRPILAAEDGSEWSIFINFFHFSAC